MSDKVSVWRQMKFYMRISGKILYTPLVMVYEPTVWFI